MLLHFGVIPGAEVQAIVTAVLAPLRRFVAGEVSGAERVVWFAGWVLLALGALALLLRELTLGRRVAQRITVSREPGAELTMTATAVEHLVVGAAREAGAVEAVVYLDHRPGTGMTSTATSSCQRRPTSGSWQPASASTSVKRCSGTRYRPAWSR